MIIVENGLLSEMRANRFLHAQIIMQDGYGYGIIGRGRRPDANDIGEVWDEKA